MIPVSSIMSDLQELLHKIGSQLQRDLREIMRLRKMHGRPRNYGRNTLPIIYKIIERYQKEHVTPFVFMSQEDWENYQGDKPLLVCVMDLSGFEHVLRGLPLYSVVCSVYHKGILAYTVVYEPSCQVILGAEAKGSCYVLGGARIRGVCVPDSEPHSYVWCAPENPPQVAMEMYVVREPSIAALWVVMSRVGAAVIPKVDVLPSLRLLINAGECFTKSFEGYSIFGVKEVVVQVYDSLQNRISP